LTFFIWNLPFGGFQNRERSNWALTENFMKKKIAWITGTCFFDVDEHIVPEMSKRYERYDIYWIVLRQPISFYSLDYIRNVMGQNDINGSVFDLGRMCSFRAFKIYLSIIHLIKSVKYDLIYVDFMGLPYLFPLLLWSGIDTNKVIYPCHDYLDHVDIKNRKLISLYKRFIFKNFKHFQFFSKSQRSLFLEKYKEKNTFYIPLALKGFGVPQKSETDRDKVVFLFFGTIRENKGLEYLIEAANKLYEKQGDKFVVKIYGSCNNWEQYSKIIRYSECFDLQIRRIENDEVADLFSASDYLILPYKDVTQSGPLLISYYYGIPVIASGHDGFREYIQDKKNGFLFKNRDSDDLFCIMSQILDGNYSNKKIKENLQKFVSDNIVIEKIIALYDKAFGEIIKENNKTT